MYIALFGQFFTEHPVNKKTILIYKYLFKYVFCFIDVFHVARVKNISLIEKLFMHCVPTKLEIIFIFSVIYCLIYLYLIFIFT